MLPPSVRAALSSLALALLGGLFGFAFVSRHLLGDPRKTGGTDEAIVLLALAGVCLAGAVWAAVAPALQRAKVAARRSPLDLVYDVVRRTRTFYFCVGAGFLAFGGLMAAVPFLDPTIRGRVAAAVVAELFAAVCFLVGGFGVVRGIGLIRPEHSPVVQALTTNPERIATASHYVATYRRAGVKGERHFVDLGFAGGGTFRLEVAKEDLPGLMAFVRERAPRARVGRA